MADENDTPPTDATPAPRRRAAPRKAAASDAPKRTTRRKAAGTGVVAKVEEAASSAAVSAKDAVTSAAAAIKPRAGSRRTARSGEGKKAPGKRGATKGASKAGGKGVRWGAIAAGVGAAGAAAAALLTLRGSSAKSLGAPKKPIDISGSGDKGPGHGTAVAAGGAHQPDGTDSSASFRAGIADENTVPDNG